MPGLEYEHSLNIARNMKEYDTEIRVAIRQVNQDKHGVVALRFSDQGRNMKIEILDEPLNDNVLIYPGE